MADHPRIEDLRRRLQKDPASIAFAQLAEEYRRAGQIQEAVDACRAGLVRHPGYPSAHVTLGRALLELGQLDEAQRELELVLKSAPENLAATRSLAEIHDTRGSLPEALIFYKAALALARNDPDLEQRVSGLTQKVGPPSRPASAAAPADSMPAAVAPVNRPPLSIAAVPASRDDRRQQSDRARRTIAALERWLEAIHVARTQRHA